jgi:hypothetical protein
MARFLMSDKCHFLSLLQKGWLGKPASGNRGNNPGSHFRDRSIEGPVMRPLFAVAVTEPAAMALPFAELDAHNFA